MNGQDYSVYKIHSHLDLASFILSTVFLINVLIENKILFSALQASPTNMYQK